MADNLHLDAFLPRGHNQTEEEYLAAWEEHWNKRIDRDVTVLGEGLQKIVEGSEVSTMSPIGRKS